MHRQQLLDDLAQAIADRNYAYKHSFEIIQAARTARKVNRYSGYGYAVALVITGTVYGIADAEAADLICQTTEFICLCWRFIVSSPAAINLL
jgi:hypothetical protein